MTPGKERQAAFRKRQLERGLVRKATSLWIAPHQVPLWNKLVRELRDRLTGTDPAPAGDHETRG